MAEQLIDRNAVTAFQDRNGVVLFVDRNGVFLGDPLTENTGIIIIRTVHELRSA